MPVQREAAKNELGLAAGDGQFAERLSFPMTALVIRELTDRAAPILDRVDFDFVLSVGEDDGLLAHDFGWVVNRVSCRPSETAYPVGGARTRPSLGRSAKA